MMSSGISDRVTSGRFRSPVKPVAIPPVLAQVSDADPVVPSSNPLTSLWKIRYEKERVRSVS